MSNVEFEVADHKEEIRKFVCLGNLSSYNGSAVTIMGKMKARNSETSITIWDGSGDVVLTADDEEFFAFLMEENYVVAEGFVRSDNQIEVREVSELDDANDETLKLRAQTALMMDKWAGVVYAQ
ncbi:Oidioi.mRNA.OKI2018_I69.XSR.g15402.t1.cds [Oikopleura dioica]|uniref:Oidioi.mRNA.OKI2018_I69.XSR.g15402.t1.cds n=1 Tax=Oikopleura dioica TaxID=34765 RepID=A0ABN7SCR8_OIKDI|nr:Oidioi.mRNA.OKI2018_I69.XSR.g15402.t1.cds [Oikopleura dioica]